jgi:ABC-type dipeptide/oligopeptide/nickel transport system permease component
VIIETLFNLPGLGSQFITSLSDRDYPMVSGINLFFATFVLFNNLLIDLLYAYLDPRIRYQ